MEIIILSKEDARKLETEFNQLTTNYDMELPPDTPTFSSKYPNLYAIYRRVKGSGSI